MITMASILKLSFNSKGYDVKNHTLYVIDLVCLTIVSSPLPKHFSKMFLNFKGETILLGHYGLTSLIHEVSNSN